MQWLRVKSKSKSGARRFVGVFMVLSMSGMLTGCGGMAERIAWYEARVVQAKSLIEEIDDRLDPASEKLAALEQQLKIIAAQNPDGETAGRLREAITVATQAIQAAQSRRTQAHRVIETAQASIETLKQHDAGWGDELVAAGDLGQVIAPLTGAAAPWVVLGSHLIAGLGGLLIRRPGDLSGKQAKLREDDAWDEADGKGYQRGYRVGRAEGRLETLAPEKPAGAMGG